MFLDADLKTLTKAQLEERLKSLRDQRKASYTAPKKMISIKASVIPELVGMDNQIAAKILAELTAMMETGI